MKTSLTVFALAAFAISAGAQTTTAHDASNATESAQASAANSTASASAAQATAVSAVLNKRIDSKSAKVGDEVSAKTTSEARFADGTKIPKGSRLVGHVTAVEPRSKDNRDGHVAFCFDHAQLKGGQEMTVNVLMHSISAPAALSASAMDSEDPMGGGGGGLGGGGSMPSRGGGGAVGGAAAGAGGAVRGAGGVAGNTVGGLGGNTEPAVGATTNSMGNASATLGRDTAGMAGMAGASGSFAGPVANLPGVSFMTVNAGGDAGGNAAANGASASAGTSTATMLTAHNSNVTLDSGSQMTMAISAQH